MFSVVKGLMWNNKLLQAHLLAERQQRQKHQQEVAALTAVVRGATTQQQQQQQLLNSTLARINDIEAKTSAAPSCTPDATKQLNERINHVVTIIGELGDYTRPATISSAVAAIKTSITILQTRPDAATKNYKMPHFDINKFDDYNKSDALTWWQRFLTEAACRTVPADDMMKALYLQLIGGAQTWMNHLAATNKCTIAELHTHIPWKEFEKLWFTRFMVRNVVKAAMNEVYTSSQGNMPTRDSTTKWQKIVTTPGFDLSSSNQRSEFFLRSCAGLRTALGNEYDYASFQTILDRANLVIQTDDKAANERQSQPHYVAKSGYQRPAHNNVVISDETVDLHASAASSSDGGIVAALPPKRPKRVRKNKATQETASTGTGQQPWTTYKITKEIYDLRQRIRDAIAWNTVEEMGLVFLHALPSPDGPAASPPDPRITHLLDEYGDVFEAPTGTVPDRPIRHGITLEAGAVPPRGCIYRMSEEELEVLRAQLDDLLYKDWIRPSCSPYGAPVLFVRKKNKDLRLCIDYRKLNAQTVENADPLPRIDDLLERLCGATYFSKLDLKSGYHQIEIQPQDRYKTAFKTRYGHFEWVVMPFGLTNAPATFQAAMTTEFRDLLDRSVLIYLDDILVYSRTLDEHIIHLRAVLNRLRLAKYKANRDKCEFAKQELEYSGQYVTPKGIRPLPDKIQAIVDWPEPHCTMDVRSFMGLAGYYQRFVESYSKVSAPL
uniref:Reverse transcriptase domain-containing protein n=1 Tax=Chara braunii TaxID=69332 RepID=A0A388KM38_CHABU